MPPSSGSQGQLTLTWSDKPASWKVPTAALGIWKNHKTPFSTMMNPGTGPDKEDKEEQASQVSSGLGFLTCAQTQCTRGTVMKEKHAVSTISCPTPRQHYTGMWFCHCQTWQTSGH